MQTIRQVLYKAPEYGLAVYSYPKKQLFVALLGLPASVVLTAGMFRRVLEFESKCSKKRSNVTNAAVRFSLTFIQAHLERRSLVIKLIRTNLLANALFSALITHSLFNHQIYHVLYEPKIQFDQLNKNRRASIKKRLRKSRNYYGD